MRIFILRHGIAEERREGLDDSKRALTPEGRRKLRRVLAVAKEAGVSPQVLLTSPYVRAAQTARLAKEVLGLRSAAPTGALLPDSDPDRIWREIASHSGAGSVMIVGHDPVLSDMANWLLGTRSDVVRLKKGALLSITVDDEAKPQRATLDWLLTPKLAGAARPA